MDHPKAKSLIGKLLEAYFYLLYHRLAWSYDLVASLVSFGRWNKWIRSIYPLLTGGRILEIGFGPGHLQVDFASSGKTIFGIDESPQMCRMAKDRLESKKLLPQLARANALALPLPSQSFDCVVATFPSPYIFQPGAISEIHRILRASGSLLILLAAQPQGTALTDHIINLLFRLSGEAPPPEEWVLRLEGYFREHGFDAHHRWLHYRCDRLLLIEASPFLTNSQITLDLTTETG